MGQGRGTEVALRHCAIHEPQALGGARIDRAPAQHEVHGRRGPDEPDAAHGAAEAWMDAEQDFGQPQAGAGVVHRHPMVQCERQLHPPPRQKPLMAATVGNDRASMRSKVACPSSTSASAACVSVMDAISRTSAPAMKPLALFESRMRAVGGRAVSSSRTAPSSFRTFEDRTLVADPAWSRYNQAMPVSSRSIRQCW